MERVAHLFSFISILLFWIPFGPASGYGPRRQTACSAVQCSADAVRFLGATGHYSLSIGAVHKLVFSLLRECAEGNTSLTVALLVQASE
jgi:hypothetical protein